MRLARDVYSARRLVEHQHVHVVVQQARERDLLLIAARETRHFLRVTRCADIETRDPLACALPLPRRRHEKPSRGPFESRQRHVVRDVQVRREPLAGPVFAEHAHPVPPPIRRRERTNVDAELHRSFFHRGEPEEASKQPCTAGAEQPGNPENLAAMQRERRRLEPLGRKSLEGQQRGAHGALPAWIQVFERASDHQADNLIAAPLGCHAFAGVASVAQHDEAVGDLRHLLDEVRDVHDCEALLLEPANQLEQLLYVVVREAARGLVEHEYAATECQRSRDFHELLRCRRKLADRRVEGNIRVPELPERRTRREPDRAAVNDAERARHPLPRRLDAERDVVHDAQVRRERELLINHRHAGLASLTRVSRLVRRVIQRHRSRIWNDGARKNRHQRALARAVLADERAYFPAAHSKIDTVEGNGAAERLAHAAHFELRACLAEAARRRGYGFNHRAASACQATMASFGEPRRSAAPRRRDRSGCSSSFTAGSDILSRVTSCAPVSIRFSTGRP